MWSRPNEDALVKSLAAGMFVWAAWLALLFATGDLRTEDGELRTENVVKSFLLCGLVPGVFTFVLARMSQRQWRFGRYALTTVGLTLVLLTVITVIEVFLILSGLL